MFLVERSSVNEEQALLPHAAVPHYIYRDLCATLVATLVGYKIQFHFLFPHKVKFSFLGSNNN